jgi:hypothetical protein
VITRSGYCIQFLLLALLAGAGGALGQTNVNTGTTGLAWVFANGVMDWNTFQFKPLVQVTLNHLGKYDTNGNWVGSNHGLLTGKYAQISIESLNQFDPSDFGMLWMNDLLCHHRRRTRRSFDRNSQGNCCVASHSHSSLPQCGAVVAAGDTAQSFMFLGAVTARGPPESGHQNVYPFNGALDRTARQFCTAPLLPPFTSHDLTSERNASGPFLQSSVCSVEKMVCGVAATRPSPEMGGDFDCDEASQPPFWHLFRASSFLNEAGALFDPTGFPNKYKPTPKRSYYEIHT